MDIFSRREFLRMSCLGGASFFFGFPFDKSFNLPNPGSVYSSYPLGRILYEGVQSFQEPHEKTQPVNTYTVNDVVDILDPIVIRSDRLQDETWHPLQDGSFIKASSFQPVRDIVNEVREDVPKSGLLAEITVPFTTAWHDNKNIRKPNETFYYGSTHWVYGLGKGPDEKIYYLVREDRWGDGYYVQAAHMHIINEEELAPISADVKLPEKRIQISLNDQIVIAYEKDQPVFMSAMASGLITNEKDLSTPPGRYTITYKRPSRHMVHSDLIGSTSSALFGVPWVSYFTSRGIAFHGTFWHNEFNHPRSHGCVNLPIPAARWLYLWALPVVPPKEKTYVSNYGTPVEVI